MPAVDGSGKCYTVGCNYTGTIIQLGTVTGLQRISRKGIMLRFPPMGPLRSEAKMAAYTNTVLGKAVGTTMNGEGWTLGLPGLLNDGIRCQRSLIHRSKVSKAKRRYALSST